MRQTTTSNLATSSALTGTETVSRFPAGYRFAFTIVHDADSAYSQRLAPLFDVFDDLGFRITASAFAFWADWAKGGRVWSIWREESDPRARAATPMAVPFCDVDERRFYEQLAERGHEIALHSASDTSNTTDEVLGAFEVFRETFGHYPAVYVEHSVRSKKDALGNEGALPESPFYSLGVLRQYDPWIWVDCPGSLRSDVSRASFQIPPGASFSNERADARYGLAKTFVRTGRWNRSDGDGFLHIYSTENIDALADEGGMAIVYTHLDKNWLDLETFRMRRNIQERLEYLAGKGGWYVPAGELLDRASATKKVVLQSGALGLEITNTSAMNLERVSLAGSDDKPLVVINHIPPGTTIRLS